MAKDISASLYDLGEVPSDDKAVSNTVFSKIIDAYCKNVGIAKDERSEVKTKK